MYIIKWKTTEGLSAQDNVPLRGVFGLNFLVILLCNLIVFGFCCVEN